ncbi:MAG: MFS transporter [Acidimicrobiia bacterium]
MPAAEPRSASAYLRLSTLFHFLSMGVFLSGLPLLLTRELHSTKAAVGFAVGSFSLTAVATRPFVGRAIDRRGRKAFLIGAPIVVAASAAGLLVAGFYAAVVALRLAQGAAGAAYYTSAATVANDLATPEQRADAISKFSLFLYAGFSIGPALGEWLIVERGFAWAWLAALGFAAIAATVATQVPETRVDHDDDHVVARRLLHPAALGPGLVLMTVAVGYSAIGAFSPIYARSIGMSSSGVLYVAFAVSIFAVRLVSGRLADRYGRVAVSLPGLLAGAAGMALLALVQEPVAAVAGVALFGTAHALAFPALMALAVERASDRERGEVLGSFTACFDVGAASGASLVGAVADRAGFEAGWLVPAGLCVLGAAALVGMGRRARPATGHRASSGDLPLPEPAGT